MNTTIAAVKAYSEFDSSGRTTLAGKLSLNDGREFTATIPNHLVKNKLPFEYLETGKAVKYVNELLAPKLQNINPLDYEKIDAWLDKIDQTANKQLIGSNTSLLISLLVYQAAAAVADLPLYRFLNQVFQKHFYQVEVTKLPVPIFTLISGGLHGSANLNFQEFSVIFSSNLSYHQAVSQGAQLHQELEKVFQYRNIFTGVGADGAYVPNLSSNFDALEIIKEAIFKNNYKIGLDVFFALDAAASNFYKGSKYYLSEELGTSDTEHLLELYEKIFKEYRFLILEDPFAESDLSGWKQAVGRFGEKAYVLGDDLLQSNVGKLEKAIKDNLCSAAINKLSFQPTVWHTLAFVAAAKKHSLKTVLAQSAIETNDTFLADLAVATQVDYAKFGPVCRGERVAKHNRLLAIEHSLSEHDTSG